MTGELNSATRHILSQTPNTSKNDQFHRGSGCPNTSIMPQASPVAASMTVPSGSTLKATSYLGSANAIKCPHISHISHMFGEEANVVHVVS